MDHLSRWIRFARQELQRRAGPSRRAYPDATLEDRIMGIDSVLSSINEELIAKAAFETGAFARSLMTFENLIRTKLSRNADKAQLQQNYDRLHQIYAQLEEPDGMEGIATMVLEPSLEHQIRHHETLGHWTSAQSCWELKLQQSPDDLNYHMGLLRCLRSLGHYGTYLAAANRC
jgi:serine/threonine-protein kinase ATR